MMKAAKKTEVERLVALNSSRHRKTAPTSYERSWWKLRIVAGWMSVLLVPVSLASSVAVAVNSSLSDPARLIAVAAAAQLIRTVCRGLLLIVQPINEERRSDIRADRRVHPNNSS